MLAVFEPLKRPQDGRVDLDRPVGTEAELAAYHAAMARAERRYLTRCGQRIEGLARPEIDRVLGPDGNLEGRQDKTEAAFAAGGCGQGVSDRGIEAYAAQRELVRRYAERLEAAVREIAPDEVKAALKPLDDRIAAIKAARPPAPPHAYIWTEDGPNAPRDPRLETR